MRVIRVLPYSLSEILDVDPAGPSTFTAGSPPTHATSPRIYGGQIVAQSLMAASRTVPADRTVHSVHAYFLRNGSTRDPLEYDVASIRDGSALSTRAVTTRQGGEDIVYSTASFVRTRPGASLQLPTVDAPDPDSLPSFADRFADVDPVGRTWYEDFVARFPLEVRFVGTPPRIAIAAGETIPPRTLSWMRATEKLGDGIIHPVVLAFMSDAFLLSSALLAFGQYTGQNGALVLSLDHSMWFHAAFRADDWLLYEEEAFRVEYGRGLARGSFFDRSGRLVATVMQEGLVRLGS
jgi:acyl-CoA thioesterase-2